MMMDTRKEKLPSVAEALQIMRKRDPSVPVEDLMFVIMELSESKEPSIAIHIKKELFKNAKISILENETDYDAFDWRAIDEHDKEIIENLLKEGKLNSDDFV